MNPTVEIVNPGWVFFNCVAVSQGGVSQVSSPSETNTIACGVASAGNWPAPDCNARLIGVYPDGVI